MNDKRNGKLKSNAQALRKNMTKQERHLWYDFLKGLSVNVNRQKPIGPYIVDFYIASSKLIIELDGSQHYEPNNQKSDNLRDEYFNGIGIRVLRYPNNEIDTNFEAVCKDILANLV